MSGETVVLAAERDSLPYRAIAHLAEVAPRLPRFALIGGLAVITRLGQAHRATNDLDTVSDDEAGLLNVLTADGFDRQGDSVLLDTDLKRDVIDVSEGDPDYLPYATHRLAFDIARLLQRFGPDVLAEELITLAERGLVARISDLAARNLVEPADRTAAAITRSAVQGVQTIAPEQLQLLGRAFRNRLAET